MTTANNVFPNGPSEPPSAAALYAMLVELDQFRALPGFAVDYKRATFALLDAEDPAEGETGYVYADPDDEKNGTYLYSVGPGWVFQGLTEQQLREAADAVLAASIIAAVDDLLDGVAEAGNTLAKLKALADIGVDAAARLDDVAPEGKYEAVVTPSISTTPNVLSASSVFSGWGGQAGTPQNFNRVNFYIYPFDAADLPANVRVRVYETNRSGTLLADSGSVALSGVTYNTLQKVQVDLPSTVANAGSADIWIEYYCDGKTGVYAVTPAGTHTGAPKARYSSNQDLAAPNSAELPTSVDIYFETVLTEDQPIPTTDFVSRVVDAIAASSANQSRLATALIDDLTPTASIHLPSDIYAVVGHEKNLYFDGFIETDAAGGLGELDIDVTCAVGRHEARRWTYTPASGDTGTDAITITVYHRGTLLATWSGTVNTTAAATGSAATRKVLVIGDSTSDITYSNSWQPELFKLGAAQGPAFTYVGTVTGSGNDSGGVSRSVSNEGRSGKTANFFANDGTSPFDNSGFDFANYLTSNSITLAADDWVVFALGINDVFSQPNDTNLAAAVPAHINNLNTMITDIQSAVSGIRIGICIVIPPAGDGFGMEDGQDAFGANYNSGQYARRYRKNRMALIEAQVAEFEDSEASDIYVFCTHAAVDPIYGFPTTVTAANARTSETYKKQGNAVHPAPSGYYQLADEVFACVKSQE